MLINAEKTFTDPRNSMSSDELRSATVKSAPRVGAPSNGRETLGLIAGATGALALGAVTFFGLSSAPEPSPVGASVVAEQAPTPIAVLESDIPIPNPVHDEFAYAPETGSRALPMILDNSSGGADASPTGQTASAEGEDSGAGFISQQSPDLSNAVRARPAGDLSRSILQGTIIPAVLETALNSDLPGYARAVVSRDVRSFDGVAVLIPRGSRLIGQYRSAASIGQSRAFIVWSRLIRPDGVSIELGSPALDEDGATGLPGRVDRHLAQRFGSALLLSVIGALPAIAADGSSNSIVIGTSTQAQGAATQALGNEQRIAPTIRVPLGTPIQVFTARDLQF